MSYITDTLRACECMLERAARNGFEVNVEGTAGVALDGAAFVYDADAIGVRVIVLDAIAADVVNYECEVTIQAPRTNDYPWLANLLTKRVKKLNPDFDLKIEKQILRTVPAQMVLSPRKP